MSFISGWEGYVYFAMKLPNFFHSILVRLCLPQLGTVNEVTFSMSPTSLCESATHIAEAVQYRRMAQQN